MPRPRAGRGPQPSAAPSTARSARTLGTDPYGHGATARREKDRRELVIAGAIVIYYLFQAVATVTAVTIVSA
ncbi:hypothetical protein [Streptomyces megasporus]|uniref:hypothetical protein n=1 Tax=Streptomyces megasporus TaxID=44060 RepID=UPI00055DFAC6|nr:hypothetical protein [Streptomyces megasporus]